MFGISMSIVLIRGDRGYLMHILVFLIYHLSGKTHFDNYYYRVNADFYRVNNKQAYKADFSQYVIFSYCKKEKTEALGKNGVQNKIVLYPNLCYIEACYNEVDLYLLSLILYIIN